MNVSQAVPASAALDTHVHGKAALTVADVSRSYAGVPPVEALRGVDLELQRGDYLCVEGPSGSGKSTLMNLLALIDRPTSGEVFVGERPTSALGDVARARLRSDTFGFVFQSFHLMPRRSAVANVATGLLYRGVRRRERFRLARAALADVGLAHREDVQCRMLSGGEMQRVAIARAVVGRPPVIVADEPTGNLDSASGSRVVEQLEQLNQQGTTLVVVTHDGDLAARAPRRLLIRDGQIAEHRRADSTLTDADWADADWADVTQTRPATAAMLGKPSTLRLGDLFTESLAAFGGRPWRAALQVAAVALSVAMVVVIMGLSATARGQVASTFDRDRNQRVDLTVPPVYNGTVASSALPKDFQSRLSALSGVVSVAAVERMLKATVVTSVGTSETTPLAAVSDLSSDALGAAIAWAPNHAHILGRHELVVGKVAADVLGVGPVALDPSLTVAGTRYAVVGTLTSSDVAPDLASALLLTSADAREVSTLESSQVYLKVVPGAAGQVAQQAPIALNAIDGSTIEVEAPPDPQTLRDSVQGSVQAALVAITVVAVLASVLGVANSMLGSVIERVGELGLRRAVGARMRHVVAQIAAESLATGLLGGVCGLMGGLFALLAVTLARHWQPVLDLRTLPVALLGGAAVGVIGGLPASLRAGFIQPVDALRR